MGRGRGAPHQSQALDGQIPKEDLIKLIVAAIPASERPPVQQEIDISVDLNQLVIRFTFDRYAI